MRLGTVLAKSLFRTGQTFVTPHSIRYRITRADVEAAFRLERCIVRHAGTQRTDDATGGNGNPRADRHRGKLNVGFADNHVEHVPYETLLLDLSPQHLKRWHTDNEPHLEWFR
ncbi:MAG: hypothetical protein FJ398_13335 [Verrucomicrobia bacterium]|nr:hypothetical protein [Verrucomicrobiota bacterium]